MNPRDWFTAAAIAMTVAAVGLVELAAEPFRPRLVLPGAIFVMLVGIAVAAARWAPGAALGIAWTAGAVQVLGTVPVLVTEGSLIVVLFAAARWGRTGIVAAAAASVALIPLLAVEASRTVGVLAGRVGRLVFDLPGAPTYPMHLWSLVPLAATLLGLPFLAGLALRFLSGARVAQAARRVAERDAHQAHEIAQLQEAQNRLARDVHDVVGHSLTVILAQAESAQFIEDPEKLKRTMQTIANSARTSLQDVRQVLRPGDESSAARRGGLDTLIETVRDSGHPIEETQVGDVRPLPPELDAVAYRVLQEMLTNAIKHGRRDRPVTVERRWPARGGAGDGLRITVRNAVDDSTGGGDEAAGQGVAGMRRRLESVGGRLDVVRDGDGFTAIASVPVRVPTSGAPA